MSSKPKKVLSQAVPSYSKICSAQHVKSADGKIAGLYDLEETIGKGHYAVVKLARHVFTGEKVAVKVIDKTKLDEVSRAHLFQEVRCMKLVQHPHVVRLYEVIDTATKLYLVLEWGDGGDMYDYIMKHDRGLQESMARRYFAQIVQAIDYCHQLHVVHRDLKPENVVFFETATPEAGGIVKLTDFGFSNKFVPGRKLETSCGSLAYSAPEILLGDSYDAPAVDVWSLGVILYMLVCGEPPFQEANDSETLTMIMDCNYRMPPHISPLCQDIIGKMLVREPSQRATICDIARHPWMLEEGNLISPSFVTPLVCRESLTDEDHCHIVQRIVEGKIASTEEIASSLDSSAYNHITATYFLLAERLLRKRKEAAAAISSESTSGVRQDLKPVLSPLGPLTRSNPSSKEVDASGDGLSVVGNYQDSLDPLLSPLHPLPAAAAAAAILNVVPPPPPHSPSPTAANLHSEINLLVCRCALIHEDSAEGGESAEEETGVTTINQSQSDSELIADEEGSELAELGYMSSRTYGGLLDVPSSSSRNASKQLGAGAVSGRPLVSVRSSPQLLNEICEEAEHDDDADSRSRLHDMMQLQQPMSHNSRRNSTDTTHRRSERFHRVHHRSIGLATTRVPSCSSSDASDTDDVEQRAAAGKQPQQKQKVSTSAKCYSNLPRRDSSEHSSDNDNLPTGRQVGGGGGGDSGSLQSRGTPCGGKGRHLSDRERHSGGGGGKQTTNWCAAASSSADRLANDGSGSDNRRQSADAVAAGELNGLSSSYISTASVLKRHLEDVESMSLPQCYDDDDHYIPESEDYFGDEKSRAASDGLSPKSQWLSNVIRFHSMEFSRMIDHHHPGKSKVKNVTKARCHSTVDIGCRDSRIMAAALFAKLSCIDMVERRSHSVSCLRVRKVSM